MYLPAGVLSEDELLKYLAVKPVVVMFIALIVKLPIAPAVLDEYIPQITDGTVSYSLGNVTDTSVYEPAET